MFGKLGTRAKTDIGKYSFVNRAIENWNQLLAEALGTFLCKPKIFRKRGNQLCVVRSERNRSVAKIV